MRSWAVMLYGSPGGGFECDWKKLRRESEQILCMWTKVPPGHRTAGWKDNHEVPGVLLSIKVGDESGQEVMVVRIAQGRCDSS